MTWQPLDSRQLHVWPVSKYTRHVFIDKDIKPLYPRSMKQKLAVGLPLALSVALIYFLNRPEVATYVIASNVQEENQTEGSAACATGDCTDLRSVVSRLLDNVQKWLNPIEQAPHPISQATEKYLVSLYQSCDVLESRNISGGYRATDLNHPEPECKPPRPFPSYFIDRERRGRGKPRISRDYEITTPANRLDCSGFIGGVLKAAGLKIYPTENEKIDELSNPEVNTAGLRGFGTESGLDCFINAEFTTDEALREGDILNWRVGRSQHAVIISKVGEDPFGIQHLDASKCNARHISVDNFDFEISHSLGSPRSGPIKHDIRVFLEQTSVTGQFIQLAINACKATHHREAAIPAVLRGGAFKVLRHLGEEKPNCISEIQPTIKGDACYHQCRGT